MSIEENVQTVKAFFAAIGRGDKQGCWRCLPKILSGIIPGEDWP
jgi:ketosteroid isomerase-like protein